MGQLQDDDEVQRLRQRLKSQVDTAAKSLAEVLHVVTGLLIANHLQVYDSGSSQYFEDGYDAQHDVRRRADDYRATLTALIRSRSFDLIALTRGRSPLLDSQDVKANYRRLETITLPMPYTNQSWKTELWVPQDS